MNQIKRDIAEMEDTDLLEKYELYLELISKSLSDEIYLTLLENELCSRELL